MKFILGSLIYLLVLLLGFMLGKQEKENRYSDMVNKLKSSEIKVAKINMIIRAFRNEILREETVMRALPKELQEANAFKYATVKGKVKLIKEIEEEISHEM